MSPHTSSGQEIIVQLLRTLNLQSMKKRVRRAQSDRAAGGLTRLLEFQLEDYAGMSRALLETAHVGALEKVPVDRAVCRNRISNGGGLR
jgi:hypothetical protein